MPESIVAANWKMHKTFEEGILLAQKICNGLGDKEASTVVLVPPFIHLAALSAQKDLHTKVSLGAQNCHQEPSGAYTGEISATQLRSLGIDYVLIGHSERRNYFQETDQLLAAKLRAVLSQQMRPMFCCGEPLDVRKKGTHIDYVCAQVTASLSNLPIEALSKLVLVYEPIWAIGTGLTASKEQAQEMHASLRSHLCGMYAQAKEVPILYGGSVKPQNAALLFDCPNIDGLLVGGASLEADDFLHIIRACS